MTTFMMRKELELGWTEVKINSESDLERAIGLKIRDYPLPMGIHLIYSDDSQDKGSHKTFSTAIIEEDGDSQPFFKSVLVAALDEQKNLKPLGGEQVSWLRDHSKLIETATGQRIMQIDPFHFADSYGVAAVAMNGALRLNRMRGYLAITPGSMTFTELTMRTIGWKKGFVGGNLERVELAENIDIWINEDSIYEASMENLSIVIQDGEDLRMIFGKAFLGTTDLDGNCIPLSYEQADWLRAHLRTGVTTDSNFYKIINLQEAPKANVGLRA